jgi:hypothetical protein
MALGSDLAVIRQGMSCAFLSDDNACTVHASRPLACRGHLSASSSACADHYIDITNDPPPIDAFAHDAAKGTIHGIRAAMHQEPLQELHTAILTLLTAERS